MKYIGSLFILVFVYSKVSPKHFLHVFKSRGNTNSPKWELSGGIVEGAIVLGGNCLEGNCLGDNCPRWQLSWGGAIVQGEVVQGAIALEPLFDIISIFIFSITQSDFNQIMVTHILDIVFITRHHFFYQKFI